MTNEERVRVYWNRVWSRGEVEYATEFYAPTFPDHHTMFVQLGAPPTPEAK